MGCFFNACMQLKQCFSMIHKEKPYRSFKSSLNGILLVWNWYGTPCDFCIRKEATKVPYFASKKFILINQLKTQQKYGTSMEPLVGMPKYALFSILLILKSLSFWYILLNLGPPFPIKSRS